MEELKIWKVDSNDSPGGSEELLTTREMETENRLEDILAENPDMLENGLDLVGRQVDMPGGTLDLLGVDSEGRLVVFELKRGRLHRDAVAQVIDYASQINAMDLDRLYQHIAEQSGKRGIDKIDNFEVWYNNNYPEHDTDSVNPPRIVLVGLGVDETTDRMVNYLAAFGLDVSLLTFHGFKQGSDTLLARHMEVDGSNPAPEQKTSGTRNDKKRFNERVQTLGVQQLVESVTRTFRSQPGANFTISHSTTRRHFRLDFSWYPRDWAPKAQILFIELVKGSIKVGFHPNAIELVERGEFDKLQTELEEAPGQSIWKLGSINYELKLPLRSLEEWEKHKENLDALVRKVCEGYDALREKTLAEKARDGE